MLENSLRLFNPWPAYCVNTKSLGDRYINTYFLCRCFIISNSLRGLAHLNANHFEFASFTLENNFIDELNRRWLLFEFYSVTHI